MPGSRSRRRYGNFPPARAQTFRSLLHCYTHGLGTRSPRPIYSKLCLVGPGAIVGVTGLSSVLVVPSPKFHSQLVKIPVDSLVKFTGRGASPDLGAAEKFALGAA